MSISVTFRNVLKNNSPVSLNVDGTGDLGIVNIRWAQVSLRSDPVGGIIRRWALGCSSVVLVVEGLLLGFANVLNKIISRLVSDISILLQEKGVLGDFVSNIISGIFRV